MGSFDEMHEPRVDIDKKSGVDAARVQEGLAHTTTLLVGTQPVASEPVRKLNTNGYPETLPLPIITPEQIEGGL